MSAKSTVDVSFHMMAVNCRLFHRSPFPEDRYETYLPVPPDILKAFIDCVYNLILDPESIKSTITPDNLPYLMLLAEEFDCAALLEILSSYMQEIKSGQVSENIERLIKAIEEQNGEICAQIERVLSQEIDESLKQLKQIPVSRIPMPCLYRIIEKALEEMEENGGMHIDRLLCDFILTKIDSEEDPDLCSLVNFLHIDRLSWEQVERLFNNKKLEGWFCHDFPVRFLKEMLVSVNRRGNEEMNQLQARQEKFEAEMRQKMADLQAENEEYKRRLREEAEGKGKEIELRVSKIEERANEFLRESSNRVDEQTSELRKQMETAKSDISSLKSSVSSAQSDISNLKRSVSSAQSDISNLKSSVSSAQSDISNLKSSVSSARSDISNLKSSVSSARSDISNLRRHVDEDCIRCCHSHDLRWKCYKCNRRIVLINSLCHDSYDLHP